MNMLENTIQYKYNTNIISNDKHKKCNIHTVCK